MWWGAQSCQNSSQCFCFRAAQQRAKLTFDSLLYDQLAGAAWTEQIILCKQDLAKLLTFTKAPIIVAVCCSLSVLCSADGRCRVQWWSVILGIQNVSFGPLLTYFFLPPPSKRGRVPVYQIKKLATDKAIRHGHDVKKIISLEFKVPNCLLQLHEREL